MRLRSTAPTKGLMALLATAFVAACASGAAEVEPPAAPEPAEAPAASGALYTTAQAEEGQGIYRNTCGDCHFTSEFRGDDFWFNWEGSSVDGFIDLIAETMPEDNPGSLAMEQYVAITAYILQLNDYPAGGSLLTRASAEGRAFERQTGGEAP
jgi:hypothetical protein